MGFSGNVSTQLAFSTLPSTSKGPTNDSHLTRKKYVDDQVATKQNVLTAGTGITITNDVISATGGVNTIEQDTNIKDLDPGVYICYGNYKLYWKDDGYVQPKGILEVASHNTSTSRNFSIITKSFSYYSPNSSGSSGYPHIFVGEAPSNSNPTIKRIDTLASNDVATAYTSGLMSSTDKSKLNGISAGAEANVQSDWNESDNTSDSYILNKPTIPTKVSDLTNDEGFIDGLVMLTYGTSTWQDFIDAFNSNKIVYCLVNGNRCAFMAYKSNDNVEFQYYRSASSPTASSQVDEVFVYKLTNANVWTTTTRKASTSIATGTGINSSYDATTRTMTLSADTTTMATKQYVDTAIGAALNSSY